MKAKALATRAKRFLAALPPNRKGDRDTSSSRLRLFFHFKLTNRWSADGKLDCLTRYSARLTRFVRDFEGERVSAWFQGNQVEHIASMPVEALCAAL